MNNSSVQHENPDRTNEDGNLRAVQQWLGNDLSSLLSGSTIQLSQGQYEAARKALGDDYSDSLGKFVDVTGEIQESTNRDEPRSPEEQKDALNETRNTQREYINTFQSFQETYEAYQAAKEAGNEDRARELARRLKAQGDQVADLTTALREDYRTVENITGTSLSSALERINQTTANITARSQAVVVAEFIETRLIVSRSATQVSFSDPVTLTGRITTPNASTPPPNGTITLQIGDRQLETSVSDTGTFSIQYRPITIPTGEQELNLRYVPRADSVYLDAAAKTSLTVTAVTPTIDIDAPGSSLQFGRATNISGRVTVNGTAVPNLPLTVQIVGVTIDRLATDSDGSFRSPAPLPAIIAAGFHPVTVSVGVEGRAIRATSTNRTVRVAKTQTNLSVQGEWTANGVSVSGRLTAATGAPAPNQPIRIITNGTHKTTIQTTSDGTFRASFAPAKQPAKNASLKVTVVYVARETNLANSTAQIRLQPLNASGSESGSQSNTGRSSNPPTQNGEGGIQQVVQENTTWLIIGLGGIGLIGGLYWWRRRSNRDPVEPIEDAQPTAQTPQPTEAESSSEEATPLQPAIDTLADGGDPDHAVRLAFSTVRETMTDTIDDVDLAGGPMPVTHWEFYRAYKDSVPDETAFRDVTEAYERAMYAQEPLTPADASTAITQTETLLAALSDADDNSGQ